MHKQLTPTEPITAEPGAIHIAAAIRLLRRGIDHATRPIPETCAGVMEAKLLHAELGRNNLMSAARAALARLTGDESIYDEWTVQP